MAKSAMSPSLCAVILIAAVAPAAALVGASVEGVSSAMVSGDLRASLWCNMGRFRKLAFSLKAALRGSAHLDGPMRDWPGGPVWQPIEGDGKVEGRRA